MQLSMSQGSAGQSGSIAAGWALNQHQPGSAPSSQKLQMPFLMTSLQDKGSSITGSRVKVEHTMQCSQLHCVLS